LKKSKYLACSAHLIHPHLVQPGAEVLLDGGDMAFRVRATMLRDVIDGDLLSGLGEVAQA